MFAPNWLTTISPLAVRLQTYDRQQLVGDLVGGLIVAIMLVPQAMAYAMLAGLPPQVGLYASILPLILYACFGTSNSLAVGPVAMVSLLVASGVGELAEAGSERFLELCLTLALLIGVLQIVMGLFRLGFLVNFISHPVLVGFTSAAAIVIGASQLKHLFGVDVGHSETPIAMIRDTLHAIPATNLTALAIGAVSLAVLVFFTYGLSGLLKKLLVPVGAAETIAKFGPLVVVALGAVLAWAWQLKDSAALNIVGAVPAGLPAITWPSLSIETIGDLLPTALVIAMVGYLESFSVAKALAGRNREKVDANRELFALGIADLGAAFSGGYPVTGGFSRSVVNHSAGVRTPLGSVFTALMIAFSVAFLSPLFFYIPKAVLAAIILAAVVTLIDFRTPWKMWQYSRTDAIATAVTFIGVLTAGLEVGIGIGVVATIMMKMWQTSRPHIAEVGRVAGTEHFRNIDRHEVETIDGVFAFRVDESLNFANAPFIESYVQDAIADRPHVKRVLLIASGINEIDATGVEVLEAIRSELNSAGVIFYLSDVKGPVVDVLTAACFDACFLRDNVFLSADLAMKALVTDRELDGLSNNARGQDTNTIACSDDGSVTAHG